MKKLRERLSNKKGFTLVELIVVIVIILILAAVLIPNVMRYIESARKSAFQSEASGYLTEITGYEAEYYAQTAKDANELTGNDKIGATNKPLTGWNGGAEAILITPGAPENGAEILKKADIGTTKAINVWVDAGAVKAFNYTDGTHFVSWNQDNGWTNVDEETYKSAASGS